MFEAPFKVGDIIREKYTQNYFLVLDEIPSERTGHTTHFYVKNLTTSVQMPISWIRFDEYVSEG